MKARIRMLVRLATLALTAEVTVPKNREGSKEFLNVGHGERSSCKGAVLSAMETRKCHPSPLPRISSPANSMRFTRHLVEMTVPPSRGSFTQA